MFEEFYIGQRVRIGRVLQVYDKVIVVLGHSGRVCTYPCERVEELMCEEGAERSGQHGAPVSTHFEDSPSRTPCFSLVA